VDKLRIFLADDHHVVRAGLKALINNQLDMEVIGEAGDGRAALAGATALAPDVMIMDITMPIMGGAEATQRMRETCPNVRVLALTVHEDEGYLEQLVQSGAAGYVLKRAVADDLIHAIRAVAKGGAYLDPTVAGIAMAGSSKPQLAPKSLRNGKLSERETEVMQLIAKGHTNREIAGQLQLSTKTVETHKARAMDKLGLETRADIVSHAMNLGWLTVSPE
jgi:DNA-binding NarL/FixJ family response regulator